MGPINLEREKAPRPSSHGIITREEYEALMSELAQEPVSKSNTPISGLEEKVRKLEFNLMVLVGLVLVVLMLCQNS
jgi:hypothetical protein